jgi:hypothetical protein
LVTVDGGDYDAGACRWLARWLSEAEKTSIETTAEIAAALADLPGEPSMLALIEAATSPPRRETNVS